MDNNMDFIGTFEPVVKGEPKVISNNLDNKDYSPFKSYTPGWGNDKDQADNKNFATVTAAGIDNDCSLAAKAPGYRISPSGGPLVQQTGWGGVNVTTVTSNSERQSSSAPGSPIMPLPIGPPVQMTGNKVSTTSPGSEPDQYRTGSSL